jgi:hypothetical protein
MSHTIDQYFAAIGVWSLICSMIATGALRYFIDDAKIKNMEKPSVLFRDMVPPRTVLTVVGLRIWWFRLGAFLVGILFIILAASLEKKEPIQPLETTRGQ